MKKYLKQLACADGHLVWREFGTREEAEKAPDEVTFVSRECYKEFFIPTGNWDPAIADNLPTQAEGPPPANRPVYEIDK